MPEAGLTMAGHLHPLIIGLIAESGDGLDSRILTSFDGLGDNHSNGPRSTPEDQGEGDGGVAGLHRGV